MAVLMPASDASVLQRRGESVAALRAIVPGEGVIDSAVEMVPYESDGLTAYRQPPMVVVLPKTTEQVSQILKYCFDQGIKVVPRGAGTSLSGGALPLADGAADTAILHHVLHFAQQPAAAIGEAARVLGAGGRLLIVDFAPHEREELRTRDAHARLGFSDEQMLGWFDRAGLAPVQVQTLEGGALTVKLWLGRKTGEIAEKVKAA